MLRILKRLLAVLGVALLGALAVMYVTEPVVTTRLLGLPFGGGTGPEERVPGGAALQVPTAAPAARSIPAEVLAEAVALGERTSSHALLVYHDGAVQLEHYYPGYGPDTRTPTQSMHKSVLALLTGIAIRDGFIASVDDPAALYLPEWANDGRAKVTIRQLLQQSSGIGFPSLELLNPVGEFFQVMIGGSLAEVVLGQPLEAEPGSRFEYSNIGPQAIGIILERATGRRYAEYLSTMLWQRIGAADAFVVLDSEDNRLARVFCCLAATARSWLAVGLLHLDRGVAGGEEVVPESWMREVVTPSASNPNYGYYTWLGTAYEPVRRYNSKSSATVPQAEPFAAPDLIYFDGFGGQRVYIVPSKGLVIVRTGDLATDWDEALLPNLIIRGIDEAADAGDAQ